MSLRRLTGFWRDRRGGAALEFGLVAPLLAALLVLAFDGWTQVRQTAEMRDALDAGARYYQTGGVNEDEALSIALGAWTGRPAGGAVTVTRQCRCGETVVACTAVCPNADLPANYVTLAAQSPWTGAASSHTLRQSQVVRVR